MLISKAITDQLLLEYPKLAFYEYPVSIDRSFIYLAFNHHSVLVFNGLFNVVQLVIKSDCGCYDDFENINLSDPDILDHIRKRLNEFFEYKSQFNH